MINTIFPLRECELFRSLDDEELSRIAILCSEIELPEGTRLIREGQPAGSLYIVTAGKIALHKSLGSHPSMVRGATTVSFCQPDQIVGWSALVEPYVYTLSATAWERSTLLVIQASLLRRAMALNPDIGFRIMRCLSEVMSSRLHQVAQAPNRRKRKPHDGSLNPSHPPTHTPSFLRRRESREGTGGATIQPESPNADNRKPNNPNRHSSATTKETPMLPIVQLRQVTREDVHRISRWLTDEEIASSWFGHYACGDPIHRGYEPRLMLRASPEDWTRVFDRNRSHLVFSIYAGAEGHIGECQAVFDTHGDVEMSLLIGRKDLWQRGFGASAAIQLLDRVFYDYNVEQAWVSIPQENVAAQRLFVRLGFTPVSDYSECHAPGGGRLRATTLALPASDYYNRRVQPAQGAGAAPPIVTVTGLPGSGSENVASETARLIRARFVDDAKMTDAFAAQLNRTTGEIHALESSYASFWTRALRAMLAPWERYGTMDASAEFMYTFQNVDFPDHLEYLTKEEYIKGLDSTVSSLVAGGPTVLHGFGARRFLPKGRPTFNVFVDMPLEIRVRKALMEHEVSPDQARRALKRADKEFASIYKNLLGIDTLDPGQYDITISMSRLTVEAAARMVSGAVVRSASRRAAQRPQTAILQPV